MSGEVVMKQCTECLEVLPISGFHRDSRTADGRRSQCKPCRRTKVNAWYGDTKAERKRVRDATFAANPERRRAWDRERYRRDRDKRLPIATENAKARRAKMLAGEYDKNVTRESLRERDGDECFYCGSVMDFRKVGHGEHPKGQATIEHLVRVADGGSHTFDNTVLACFHCNIGRGQRDWTEWNGSLVGVAS